MAEGAHDPKLVVEAQYDEIDAVLRAAFETSAEAQLVRRLRADGDMIAEFQMTRQGRIGGYLALSRMQAPLGWACLAPMAVLPEWQGGALTEGGPDLAGSGSVHFGTRMLQHVQAWYEGATAGTSGARPEAIVVLGEPGFYGRWGFDLARAQHLQSPYPLSHTLIMKRGADCPEGALVYPEAFAEG